MTQDRFRVFSTPRKKQFLGESKRSESLLGESLGNRLEGRKGRDFPASSGSDEHRQDSPEPAEVILSDRVKPVEKLAGDDTGDLQVRRERESGRPGIFLEPGEYGRRKREAFFANRRPFGFWGPPSFCHWSFAVMPRVGDLATGPVYQENHGTFRGFRNLSETPKVLFLPGPRGRKRKAYTERDLSEALGVAQDTIRGWRLDRRDPVPVYTRLGTVYLYDLVRVRAWLESQREKGRRRGVRGRPPRGRNGTGRGPA